ncbi:MAG: hypothetical protein AAFR61_32160 [Bacteroidota bacterium]
MKKLSIYLVLGLLAIGCTKIDPTDFISATPEISLVNTAPLQVVAFQDSIVFEIEYTDGDGDLGTNDDTRRNVFVRDNRVDITHEFRLQQLAPDGAEIPITGTFNVILPNTLLTAGSAPETVTFTIWVVDRAGNESNEIESPEITVSE